jgi:hypothetical protein
MNSATGKAFTGYEIKYTLPNNKVAIHRVKDCTVFQRSKAIEIADEQIKSRFPSAEMTSIEFIAKPLSQEDKYFAILGGVFLLIGLGLGMGHVVDRFSNSEFYRVLDAQQQQVKDKYDRLRSYTRNNFDGTTTDGKSVVEILNNKRDIELQAVEPSVKAQFGRKVRCILKPQLIYRGISSRMVAAQVLFFDHL